MERWLYGGETSSEDNSKLVLKGGSKMRVMTDRRPTGNRKSVVNSNGL